VAPRAFSDLADLAAIIATSASPASIDHLGIIVHGDEGALLVGAAGHLVPVTPADITRDPTIHHHLVQIGLRLSPAARVIFFAAVPPHHRKAPRY